VFFLLIDFLDGDFLYETTVDVDRKSLHDGRFLAIPENKDDFVFVRLGQLELFIERLIAVKPLVQLIAVLVFDGDQELAALRVVISDIENDHVILCAEILDYSGIVCWTSP